MNGASFRTGTTTLIESGEVTAGEVETSRVVVDEEMEMESIKLD